MANKNKNAVASNLDPVVYKILQYKCEEENLKISEAVREALYDWLGLNASPLEVAKLIEKVEQQGDRIAEQEEALLKGPDGKFLPLVQINSKEKELIE